jgi:ubiquitin carboxyl-terminal hydrolase 22/27/51
MYTVAIARTSYTTLN